MKQVKKNGFTLVELLIVVAIIIIMAIIMIGSINPIFQKNKANDAQRKKDLARIKVAFEEYYNDMGCYPKEVEWGEKLRNKQNCSSTIFPWLTPWPCDPLGEPYAIQFDEVSKCPAWYKVTARLDNKSDSDIPAAVKANSINPSFPEVPVMGIKVNYGVSSTNINWYDIKPASKCWVPNQPNMANCYFKGSDGMCQSSTVGNPNSGHSACSGSNCFANPGCNAECQVTTCDSYVGYK